MPEPQRALDNFDLSGRTMPGAFVRALALLKAAAARSNVALEQLDPERGGGHRPRRRSGGGRRARRCLPGGRL
ncbi:MAG: hypothetical protein U5R48_12260 [Gammaproteobacteria bacterium]|nr:hypothetical protein [Gammaproteobacteria bacterium]